VFATILNAKVKAPGRKFITDPTICQAIIDKLDLKSKFQTPGKVDVIDVFAGNGVFSSMLNYELKPRNHVVIEKVPSAISFWKNGIDHLKKTTDNKENFVLCQEDGYKWDTYASLFESKTISCQVQPPSQMHDELLLVANLTTSSGESLLAQWISCSAYGNWIHKYGRIRMICLVTEHTAKKFFAGPSFNKRNKASVKIDLFTKSKLVAITDSLNPAQSPANGYDPNVVFNDQPVLIPKYTTPSDKSEFAVVEIEPKGIAMDNIDINENLTQNIFLHKGRPLSRALANVAPGADEDLPKMLPSELLSKRPTDITAEEWIMIYDAYDKWPLKPSDLFGVDFLEDELRGM
jgi:transcription factor 1